MLICPRFAAQRLNLLTSAAQVCGQEWLVSTDYEKVKFMLKGSAQLSHKKTVSYLVLFNATFWIPVDSPNLIPQMSCLSLNVFVNVYVFYFCR